MLFGVVLLAGLVGGRALASSALAPLRQLAATIRSILEGGPTTARVPVHAARDELSELALLVNQMLDRIDALIAAMRSSLDHVAHDLRTPVARLRGLAESALRTDRDGPEYRAALADIVDEADRVATMLDALMDLAEAEAGTMALRTAPVDLAEIVADAADLYADVAGQKGIQLATSLPGPLRIEGDRNRLAQAVANLLDNAVKYTPAGGTVGVTLTKESNAAVLTVTDTGIGIPPDELSRVWDRLFRGDRSRSQRGLGLGLSMVKAIAERHGGSVGVTSAPGAGSTFTLRLPLS